MCNQILGKFHMSQLSQIFSNSWNIFCSPQEPIQRPLVLFLLLLYALYILQVLKLHRPLGPYREIYTETAKCVHHQANVFKRQDFNIYIYIYKRLGLSLNFETQMTNNVKRTIWSTVNQLFCCHFLCLISLVLFHVLLVLFFVSLLPAQDSFCCLTSSRSICNICSSFCCSKIKPS